MVLKLLLLFVSAVFCQQLFEGDRCYKDGVEGVCLNLRQCRTALDDLKHNRAPQICSFQNSVPTICCVDRTPATTRPSATLKPPPEEEYYDDDDECDPLPENISPLKTGKKAFDKCIEYQQKYVYPCEAGVDLLGTVSRQEHCYHKTDQLIIGGTDAEKYEFPHMALLGFGELDDIKWDCGGAIISERFILTAGHCISTNRRLPVSYVAIGALKTIDANDPSKVYKVKNIIPHPDYKSPIKYNDIALLETEQVMNLNQFTVPACLHTGDVVNDTKVIVAGWGLTHATTDKSDILKRAILSKFTTTECAKVYKTNHNMKRGIDELTMSCYGDKDKPQLYQDRYENKDTCQGDSGGPVQIKDEKVFCMYTIVGVTSFGDGCGSGKKPGVYTKVAHYLPWIENIVWPN